MSPPFCLEISHLKIPIGDTSNLPRNNSKLLLDNVG